MKASKLTRFAGIAVAAAVAASVAVACSGDDNGSNPQPTTDSGAVVDGTTPGEDSSTGSDSSSSDTGSLDAPSLDTGSCKSDAGTCNSCFTAAQAAADPYNACSPYTANCIAFAATRVPKHPTL